MIRILHTVMRRNTFWTVFKTGILKICYSKIVPRGGKLILRTFERLKTQIFLIKFHKTVHPCLKEAKSWISFMLTLCGVHFMLHNTKNKLTKNFVEEMKENNKNSMEGDVL